MIKDRTFLRSVPFLAILVMVFVSCGSDKAVQAESRAVQAEKSVAALTEQLKIANASIAKQERRIDEMEIKAKTTPVVVVAEKKQAEVVKPVISTKTVAKTTTLPDTGLVVRVQTIFEDEQTTVSKSEVGTALDTCKEKTGLAISICVRAFKVQKFGTGYSVKKGTLVVVEGGMDKEQANGVAKCFNANMKPARDSEKKIIPNSAEPDDPERFVGECM